MRENDSRAAVAGRICDNSAQREVGAALLTLMVREVQAARLLIHMCDPEALAGSVAVAEATTEEFSGGFKAV